MKNKYEPFDGGVCTPKGFKASGIHCGIRKNQLKKDLALILSDVECSAAAVYTQNKVVGAPITVTQTNLENGIARAVICNSGNANTCNADGIEKALIMCELTAKATGISANDIIVASTGVIGQTIHTEPIENGMNDLVAGLHRDGTDAANAIMTTDTFVKQTAVKCVIDGCDVNIGMMAKGSGMIEPNMATMLCFMTTDVAISTSMLQIALKAAIDKSINMVSVDGDTSTNDMASIMASGLAGNAPILQTGEALTVFTEALTAACIHMARMIAKDGEGATKLITCTVTGAPNDSTARIVAKSVINSSLLKAAMFAADANCGRIMCAIGYSKADFAVETINVTLKSGKGTIDVCQNGNGLPFDEDVAKLVLMEDEIEIIVDMCQGMSTAVAWGCDLTYDYVKINGSYRS